MINYEQVKYSLKNCINHLDKLGVKEVKMKRVFLIMVILALTGAGFTQSQFGILKLKPGEKTTAALFAEQVAGQVDSKANAKMLKPKNRLEKVAKRPDLGRWAVITGAAIGFEGAQDSMLTFYQALGFGPGEITILRDENFNKASLAAALEKYADYNIVIDLGGHGGSYAKVWNNNYGGGGYTATTPVCLSEPKAGMAGLEKDFSWGILRDDNFTAVRGVNYWGTATLEMTTNNYGLDDLCFRPSRVRYFLSGDFFLNRQGQKVAQICKATYYNQNADTGGWCSYRQIKDSPNFGAAIEELNPVPAKVENAAIDIDVNKTADIPLAIIAGADTLLAVAMNLGDNYRPIDLIPNGIDFDRNGFIGGDSAQVEILDLNGDGINNPIYIPTVIRLGDGSLLSDMELLALYEEKTRGKIWEIMDFCFCGGFAEFLPEGSVFFGSVPRDIVTTYYGSPSEPNVDYLFQHLLATGARSIDPGSSIMTLCNYVREQYPTVFVLKNQETMRLWDGPGEATAGPWPNTQGTLAENTRWPRGQGEILNGVLAEASAPANFFLEQNYPNPFNPETAISYSLTRTSKVKLVIYDLLGREAATLINEQQNPGEYKLVWRAGNLPSGIYFAILTTKEGVRKTKMTLVR
jgi:hypothetical protein